MAKLEYFAMVEEIDAYAHDLAMEICFNYPHMPPRDILKNINHCDGLETWKIYKKYFRKARWLHVRNELLRKTYRWLPEVERQFLWLTK
jgi:hypothetical protein